MKPRLSETFGKTSVSLDERERLIRGVFRRIANHYDLMNDLMSMGVHRIWKWRFNREVTQADGSRFIDLAGGTGDIAGALVKKPSRDVCIVDPSVEMMVVAKKRLGVRCEYIAATAEQMPFPEESVDVLTISFGIRNTTNIEKSLLEITRVLKPGGRFYCLEFSTPQAWLRPFYDAYSRFVIPRLGAMVARHPDAYTYLIESIRVFPDQADLADLLVHAGLNNVSWDNLSFGIACIHRGRKPS